jgi:multidrug/hemolysin transport system permease protein
MSLVTFIFGEAYIIVSGGDMIDFMTIIKIIGVILLSSFASSAMVCFIVSFIKTSHTYTTVSIILGTLIGFLVGSYICIGDLPNGVQWVIKCFPPAHAAVLFRQLLMGDAMTTGFADLPESALMEFKNTVGITFEYGQWTSKSWFHILVLVVTGVIFYILAIKNMSRKVKKY